MALFGYWYKMRANFRKRKESDKIKVGLKYSFTVQVYCISLPTFPRCQREIRSLFTLVKHLHFTDQ